MVIVMAVLVAAVVLAVLVAAVVVAVLVAAVVMIVLAAAIARGFAAILRGLLVARTVLLGTVRAGRFAAVGLARFAGLASLASIRAGSLIAVAVLLVIRADLLGVV